MLRMRTLPYERPSRGVKYGLGDAFKKILKKLDTN